jgi:cation transport regulator ChaB
MPYSLTNPPDLINKLPANAKRIWINAFNAAFKKNKSEEACIKIAWTAIKNAGYSKNNENEWVRWE